MHATSDPASRPLAAPTAPNCRPVATQTAIVTTAPEPTDTRTIRCRPIAIRACAAMVDGTMTPAWAIKMPNAALAGPNASP
jgi:hypothetical protein